MVRMATCVRQECSVFHAKVVDRLAALPGVTSVAVALRLPLAGRGASSLDLQLQAGDEETRPTVAAVGNMASADYFRVMGIPLRAGRSFRSGDLRGTPAVIVSERLAKNIFGNDGRRRPNDQGVSRRPAAIAVHDRWRGRRRALGAHRGRLRADGCTFRSSATATAFRPTATAVPGGPMDVQYVIRGTQLPDGVDDSGDREGARPSSSGDERPHPRLAGGRRDRARASHDAAHRDRRRRRAVAWRDRRVQRGFLRGERPGARVRHPPGARCRADARRRHGTRRRTQDRRDRHVRRPRRSARRDTISARPSI